MGLSPELQGYAENIWRRFPEVFISLGCPDLEDSPEVRRKGILRHRVIETMSQKVIHIVLPRRMCFLPDPKGDEDSDAYGAASTDTFDEVSQWSFDDDSDCERRSEADEKFPPWQPAASMMPVPVDNHEPLRDELHRLERAVADFHGRLHQSTGGTVLTEVNSGTSSVSSSLAARRGLHISMVKTGCLGQPREQVQRRPELDRAAQRTPKDNLRDSPVSGTSPRRVSSRTSQGNYSFGSLVAEDQFIESEGSPGSMLQQRAMRRRQEEAARRVVEVTQSGTSRAQLDEGQLDNGCELGSPVRRGRRRAFAGLQ